MTNRYTVYCFAIAVAFSSVARADVTYSESKDGEPTVVKMTVTPAAESVPALRYRLVPRDMEMKPGNAAPFYYRAQLNLQPTMKAIRDRFNEETQLGLWYGTGAEATLIDKLPLEKVREATQMFDPIYDNHLKQAFVRSDCDWQLDVEGMSGIELISIHLREFQDSREIARMLALRTRLAVAERRYADAVELIRQNYRLGRDVARVPFLVNGLIGIAIAGNTNRTLVELIANPDSPNMFWGLGELPEPTIDIRPAVRFEMDFGPRVFPFIHNTEKTDRSPQEWNRLFKQSIRDLQIAGGPPGQLPFSGVLPNDVGPGLAATTIGLMGYSHAKEQLIAQGMDRDRVEKMAVGQVIAIYSERNYRRFADDWENLWQIPFPRSREVARRLDKKLAEAKPLGGGEDREILPLGTLLLPALQASREAQERLDREVASLRVIEALRMYAASHDGKFPARLDEIDQVPVPNNPATEKPFVYRLEGTTAILELPRSDQVQSGNYRYEIQIAAKK